MQALLFEAFTFRFQTIPRSSTSAPKTNLDQALSWPGPSWILFSSNRTEDVNYPKDNFLLSQADEEGWTPLRCSDQNLNRCQSLSLLVEDSGSFCPKICCHLPKVWLLNSIGCESSRWTWTWSGRVWYLGERIRCESTEMKVLEVHQMSIFIRTVTVIPLRQNQTYSKFLNVRNTFEEPLTMKQHQHHTKFFGYIQYT